MVNTGTKLAGRYTRIAAIGPDGTVRVLSDGFDNLITNVGLDRLGAIPSGENQWNFACQVGGGNTPPAVTDTSLVSFVAATSSRSSSYSHGPSPDYIGISRHVYTFATGVAAGNLSEVGIGCSTDSGNTDGPLFSRALILDSSGNPTTITVLADEELQITYELQLIPDLADKNIVLSIGGTNYDCTVRPALVSSSSYWSPMQLANIVGPDPDIDIIVYNGSIQSITENPSGTAGSPRDITLNAAYVPGNHYNDLKGTIAPNQDNLAGGYTAIVMESPLGGWQMSFSPAIPKDSTTRFEIVYRVSWARAT